MQEKITGLFRHQYDRIILIIEGQSEESLAVRPTPEKWSVHDHLAHLGRYHEIYQDRLNRILSDQVPSLERYVAEDDPGFCRWQSLSLSAMLQNTKEIRLPLALQLETISPEQWKRLGVHPRFGALSLAEWAQFFLLHETHHFYSIFRLLHRSAGF